jgi:hypothetical protein
MAKQVSSPAHGAAADIVSDARQCRGNALGTDFACSYCAVRYSRYVARSVHDKVQKSVLDALQVEKDL